MHVFPACKVLFSAEPVPLLVGPPFCLKHKLQDKYSIYFTSFVNHTAGGWALKLVQDEG